MTSVDIEQAVESIWALFRETGERMDRGFEETRRGFEALRKRFEETDRRMEERDRRLDQRIAETDRRIAETDRRIAETDRRIAETDGRIAETDHRLDRLFKETDHRLEEQSMKTEREIEALAARTRAAEDLFIGKWGRLLEALVKPRVAALFQARGIEVARTLERIRAHRGGEEMEIDLLLVNGDALVVVEVKTTLKVEDVRDFLEDLKTFLDFFPEYRGFRLYGAVAALLTEEESDRYAYCQGLFVLTMGREGLVTMRNDAAFRPRDFAAAGHAKPREHDVV